MFNCQKQNYGVSDGVNYGHGSIMKGNSKPDSLITSNIQFVGERKEKEHMALLAVVIFGKLNDEMVR